MSVTFRAAESTVVGSAVFCVHEHEWGQFDDYTQAEQFLLAWRERPREDRANPCGDDYCRDDYAPMIGSRLAGPDSATMNVSSFNARDLMEVLGLPDDDMCGGEDAETFLGRVLMALAVSPESAEHLTHEVPGEGTPMIFGGRPAGYIQDRLKELHTIAEFARAHNREVVWS